MSEVGQVVAGHGVGSVHGGQSHDSVVFGSSHVGQSHDSVVIGSSHVGQSHDSVVTGSSHVGQSHDSVVTIGHSRQVTAGQVVTSQVGGVGSALEQYSCSSSHRCSLHSCMYV